MRRTYKPIKSIEIADFLNHGAAIVDVRRAEEWRLTGVVAGSELLTFFDAQGQSQPEEWVQQLNARVAEERPLILICRTGHRTRLICEFLIAATSRPDIYNVTDGILGWLAEGLPVARVRG
ncbi:Rhodanese-related sulfurtransferase [Desulfuromusa kysingii]|uniref:Rhodanese-related sulfurtransferase n=1 Tax=Desulfuromusa kysingii TaxID=37625 RepID=A0A1H3VW24_9BACT|nr:rhodanese-like domain-containing protein [Desulfuromusa kysingii]SDZ79055.1 Rhodanese-related sulfurtransferase [Desulfuromusa kysingii]